MRIIGASALFVGALYYLASKIFPGGGQALFTVLLLSAAFLLYEVPRTMASDIPLAIRRREIENEYRRTLFQILGGGIVLLGLFATATRLDLTRREHNQRARREAREAIAQLTQPELRERLWAISSLNSMAIESEILRHGVVQGLQQFIRNTSCDGVKQPDIEAAIGVIGSSQLATLRDVSKIPQINLDGGCFSTLNFHLLNFSGASLRNTDFSSSSITSSNFSDALIRADLNGAKIKMSTFLRSRIDRSIFTRVHVLGSNFSSSSWSRTTMNETMFLRSDFGGTQIVDVLALGSNFESCLFRDSTITNSCFKQTRCRNVDFSGSHLVGCDFISVDLGGSDLEAVDLRGSILKDVNWEKVKNWRTMKISGSEFINPRNTPRGFKEWVETSGATLKSGNTVDLDCRIQK